MFLFFFHRLLVGFTAVYIVNYSTGASTYLVFFHDFGYEDHCFQPVRQFCRDKYEDFLTPTPEELKELERIKQTREAK
eukprot:m.199072 g.199072  ORF g.199072 m.199072 type:complete len:78 (-) comp16840_c3_seq13:5435-5668(-)